MNFENIEWGVDIIMNSPDISVGEINCTYKSLNNYK